MNKPKSKIRSVIKSVVIFYLITLCSIYLLQDFLLYKPRKVTAPVNETEIFFKNGMQKLQGWLLNPNQENALIYYGGNASAIERQIPTLKKAFPNHSVYLVPYRGYGNNGGEPSEKDLYSDALFVFDSIESKHHGISLMGRSLGSGIATFVAANRKIYKLILVTPYDSIENVASEQYFFLPVTLLLRDKYRSIDRVKQIQSPTLVILAKSDKVISYERSKNLIDQFEQDRITLVELSQVGHNNVVRHPKYLSSLQLFLN